jgi:hypothetical protein
MPEAVHQRTRQRKSDLSFEYIEFFNVLRMSYICNLPRDVPLNPGRQCYSCLHIRVCLYFPYKVMHKGVTPSNSLVKVVNEDATIASNKCHRGARLFRKYEPHDDTPSRQSSCAYLLRIIHPALTKADIVSD